LRSLGFGFDMPDERPAYPGFDFDAPVRRPVMGDGQFSPPGLRQPGFGFPGRGMPRRPVGGGPFNPPGLRNPNGDGFANAPVTRPVMPYPPQNDPLRGTPVQRPVEGGAVGGFPGGRISPPAWVPGTPLPNLGNRFGEGSDVYTPRMGQKPLTRSIKK
jgi:hypothetical protein